MSNHSRTTNSARCDAKERRAGRRIVNNFSLGQLHGLHMGYELREQVIYEYLQGLTLDISTFKDDSTV